MGAELNQERQTNAELIVLSRGDLDNLREVTAAIWMLKQLLASRTGMSSTPSSSGCTTASTSSARLRRYQSLSHDLVFER